jgi:hypothetical protein
MKLTFPPPDLRAEDLPEEFRHLADLADSISEEIATRVAVEVDNEITKGLQMRLGIDWQPYQLSGRLERTIFPDGSEVMSLDGEPFLHIGPFDMHQMGPSLMFTATRACTHLKGADDVLPN